ERIEREPDRRLSDKELARAGFAPERVARWFRERHGMSFQSWHRARRLATSRERVRAGASVTDAALDSGFESESGFREAFVRYFGAPPTRLDPGRDEMRVCSIGTPLGPLLAAATEQGVCLLEFADRRALARPAQVLARRFALPIVPGTSARLERLEQALADYFAG